jgi:hypothetical protein
MPSLTPDAVAAAIEALMPGLLQALPTWRWWRWFVELPADKVAFVAEDDEAWARLEREAALLERLSSRMSFAVPAVIAADAGRLVQVRRKVLGLSGGAVESLAFGDVDKTLWTDRYRPDFPISSAGRRLAADLGRALAELHQAVPAEAARSMGFPETSYTSVLDAVSERLAEHADLDDLRGAIPRLRRWFAVLPPDPVFAHRDVQPHNFAVDPESGVLLGIFDFEDAAIAHRWEDFKYLPSFGPTFTEIAVDAYRRSGGAVPSMKQVGHFHILAALDHFLFFGKDSPRWTQIVTWSRRALEAFS